MLSTPLGYKLIASDLTAAIKRTADQPIVKRETEYYLATIPTIKTVDDFIKNDRVFKYAMKAFGLEDMDYAKAFMRKVLAEGIDDSKSFANKLSDRKYYEFAETFNFARYEGAATIFERARQGTVDRYLRQSLEIDAGQTNEGVRLALYFQRKAASVETPFHLMADRQADLISKKLDVADLKEPEKLEKFLQRFTALWEIDNPSTPPLAGVTQLFESYDANISYDLLSQMQRVRKV